MIKFKQVTFGDMWQHFVEPPDHPTPVSPQYDKMRSCMAKKTHSNMQIAERALITANNSGTGKYVIYKCRWCHLFHIGHDPATKGKL